jgi:hypothetical protein
MTYLVRRSNTAGRTVSAKPRLCEVWVWLDKGRRRKVDGSADGTCIKPVEGGACCSGPEQRTRAGICAAIPAAAWCAKAGAVCTRSRESRAACAACRHAFHACDPVSLWSFICRLAGMVVRKDSGERTPLCGGAQAHGSARHSLRFQHLQLMSLRR